MGLWGPLSASGLGSPSYSKRVVDGRDGRGPKKSAKPSFGKCAVRSDARVADGVHSKDRNRCRLLYSLVRVSRGWLSLTEVIFLVPKGRNRLFRPCQRDLPSGGFASDGRARRPRDRGAASFTGHLAHRTLSAARPSETARPARMTAFFWPPRWSERSTRPMN